jgi:hypothetical protein
MILSAPFVHINIGIHHSVLFVTGSFIKLVVAGGTAGKE